MLGHHRRRLQSPLQFPSLLWVGWPVLEQQRPPTAPPRSIEIPKGKESEQLPRRRDRRKSICRRHETERERDIYIPYIYLYLYINVLGRGHKFLAVDLDTICGHISAGYFKVQSSASKKVQQLSLSLSLSFLAGCPEHQRNYAGASQNKSLDPRPISNDGPLGKEEKYRGCWPICFVSADVEGTRGCCL